MKKVIVVFAVALGISGCMAKSLATVESANTDVTIDVIAKFNGITLYRVKDGTKFIYVADRGPAEAGIQRTQFTVPAGKSSIDVSVVPVISSRR